MGTTPPYARPRYTADSQSPTSQIYTSQQSQAGSVVSPTATSPTSSTAGQQYQRIARFVGPPPVALACTECRSRHLKCDAGTPQCSRCLADKRDCTYVKSRRGWKGTRRKKVQSSTGESSKSGAALQSGTDTEGPDGGYSSGKSVLNIAPPPPAPIEPPKLPPPTALPAGPRPPQPSPLDTLRAHHKSSTHFPSQQEPLHEPSANLMQLYYSYFHPSHPFCLPPAYIIKTPAQHLTVLLAVMRYIASFFAPAARTDIFCREAETALFGAANPPPKDAFTVQALLLFAIGLHSEGERERSAQVKDFAAELALELGMNRAEFSSGTGGEGDAGRVLEESWRRTWWELYFVDGIMAAVHQRDEFRLWSVECTVPLPCEELDYAGGRIREPHSLQEFDDRYFADDSTVFSSYAYRVEAIRILGQVLSVNMGGTGGAPDETRADAADASLANWGLHLPDAKKELVNGGARRVDEMLFQAHMVYNAAIMYLNRPRSHLAIPLIPDETLVTPPTSWHTSHKPVALHTARTIAAANNISKLVTLPTPIIKHTPFLTCVITLAAVVHLSACSWLLSGDEGFLAKERIRLGVGALRSLGGVWGVAGSVLKQVKGVAREVFRLEGGGGGQGVVSEEEVLRYIEEEEPSDWGGDWASGVTHGWDGSNGL
ncbi:hypothetical protein FPQ18DRAFT_255787 [Pyronema domesticum]|nr:hypothetical protein FPQ18DRAFT_255787 [Pyronema domesticum]